MNHPPLPEGDDSRPPKGFWAPGGYIISGCMDCGRKFVGDKRARQCADCAYAAPADSDVVRLNEIRTKQLGEVWAASDGERSCLAVSEDHAIAAIRDMQEPAKQGETHPSLTTLEEMANMPGAGNDMDLWNRHSCAVLKMAAELAEAKEQLLKLSEFENNDTQSELAAWELLRTTRAELASANALIGEVTEAIRAWMKAIEAAHACNAEMESESFKMERWEGMSEEHDRLVETAEKLCRETLAKLEGRKG